MNCKQVSGQLFEYEDGNLSVDDLDSIHEHLGTCLSCNRELRSVQSLMSQAKSLRSGVAPARDLWPEISSRLENTSERQGPSESLSAASEGRAAWASKSRHATGTQWRRLGIAAVLGFLALFVSMAIRWTGSGANSGTQADSRLAKSLDLQYQVDQLSDFAAQARVESGVLETKKDLLKAIERERTTLGPEAFDQVQLSIRQVDQAIGETRVALENFPQSRPLNHRLAALYFNEAQLLKRLSRV